MARKSKNETQDNIGESTGPSEQQAPPKTRRSRRTARHTSLAEPSGPKAERGDPANNEAAISDVATGDAANIAAGEQIEAPSPPRASASKIGQVVALLERAEGATLAELVDSTGWQPHTTRAALTGLKKKGRVITKDKRGEVTCYHIAASA